MSHLTLDQATKILQGARQAAHIKTVADQARVCRPSVPSIEWCDHHLEQRNLRFEVMAATGGRSRPGKIKVTM